jgi:hypothetical protein
MGLSGVRHHRGIPGAGIAVCVPRDSVAGAVACDPTWWATMAQAQRCASVAAVMKQMDLVHIMGRRLRLEEHLFCSPAFTLTLPARVISMPATSTAATTRSPAMATYGLWRTTSSAHRVDCFYEIDRRAGMDLAKLRARFPPT